MLTVCVPLLTFTMTLLLHFDKKKTTTQKHEELQIFDHGMPFFSPKISLLWSDLPLNCPS